MNILYLTQFFSSSRGGGPLVFYNLAKGFSERGNHVHVLCNFSNENAEEKIGIHFIKPYLKESHQLPSSITQNLLYIINCLIHGIGIVKKYKIEIIHTNSFSSIIAGALLGKLSNLPVISTVHDIFSVNELAGWSNWAQTNRLPRSYALVGRLLEKASINMPISAFHTVSENTHRNLKMMRPNASVRTIYTGIDTKPYTKHVSTREYCDFILFVGRLVFFKNVGVLIKAFHSVVKVLPDAKLVIVGNGPMKEAWQKMSVQNGTTENVSFTGNISTEEKIALIRRCSALALPSLHEGFGLVILEAFAMAKPVLVSDVKPLEEIVDDGRDGFVIPKDNHLEWSRRMEYLLQNKPACKKMGENGLEKAYNTYNPEKSIDQMELLYLEVLSEYHNMRKYGSGQNHAL